MSRARRHTRPNRYDATTILAAALPWSWFVAREWSPWTDIVAAGLPVLLASYAVLLGLAWFPNRTRPFAVGVASTLVAAIVAVVLPWTPQTHGSPEDPVRIVAANVALVAADEAARVAEAILATGPDVVVVVEQTRPLDEVLRTRFRFAAATEEPFGSALGGTRQVGVYANRPLDPLGAERAAWGLRVRVGGVQPFALYAAHLPALRMRSNGESVATPADQREVIDSLIASAQTEALPVVVAGDLNATDRGRGYRALSGSFRDAMRAEWTAPTSRRPALLWLGLLLRIDHVLVPRTWCAADPLRIELPGSDHVAVSAAIGPCAPEGASHGPAA